jgi:dihydrolipoamide dehydrogenase
MALPGIEFSERVVDTWGAWSAEKQPKSIVVAGAGASGAEIASAYSRMGTKVTLVEMLDRVLPTEEPEMSRVVERQFSEDGVDLRMGSKVEGVTEQKTAVKVKVGDDEIKADFLAIAGGRRPDVDELGLDAVGLELDESGKVPVDDAMRTSAEGIYAIGDLVAGPALAHKASEEGVIAAEAIAGMDAHAVDPNLIPRATFCHPQVASVGMTEEQAKAEGYEVKVGKFKIGGTGASVVYDDRAGMVKIVGEAEFGEILGAHIVGNSACDMISEVVNTMALEGGYTELARIIHPHPTVSEAVLDAARAVEGWATHA